MILAQILRFQIMEQGEDPSENGCVVCANSPYSCLPGSDKNKFSLRIDLAIIPTESVIDDFGYKSIGYTPDVWEHYRSVT